MIKKINLPPATKNEVKKPTLPFNGNIVTQEHLSFSFACFDRSHKLFNLGANTDDGAVEGQWFIDLMDCLKSVSNQKIANLKQSLHDLHPIDWGRTNTSAPDNSGQCEYWQFRINKSKGRIIGFIIDKIFYVVWLDPHHNLTDSEGYGGVNKYRAPLSTYESQEITIHDLQEQVDFLQSELKVAEDLMSQK